MAGSGELTMDPILAVSLVLGLFVVAGLVTLVLVLAARRRQGPQTSAVYVLPGQPIPALPSPKLPPAQAWQAAGPGLAALGMTPLDAECYTRDVPPSQKSLFLKLEVKEGGLLAWLEQPCPGGALEQHLGAKADVRPRDAGRSPLAKLVSTAVGEALSVLPRQAHLRVEAPQIPGDSYKATLTTPFFSADQAPATVRVLLALDEAARRRVAGGAPVALPPAVMAWQAAAPGLTAMGMTKLDAETYMREVGDAGKTLFVHLEVAQGAVAAWLDRPCPGGFLEQHLGAVAELAPGQGGHSPLAKAVVAHVGEGLHGLPRQARLTVKAPQIPGAAYEARLTTPLSAPELAPAVARVLLALDEAAHRPAAGGTPAHLPPVVRHWQSAGAALAALGMIPLDAESYMRDVGGAGQSLYLSLGVRDGTVRGWLEQPCPGGILERHLRTELTLQPGEPGRTELAAWIAGGLRELLGALPRAAQLTLKAPEIPGDRYKATLTSPLSAPDHAALVARVLLSLDEALRRPMG